MALAVLASTELAARAADLVFTMVDGQPCARATITGDKASIPAGVVIDLGLRVPLLVHDKTAKLIGLDPAGIELKFEGLTLAPVAARSADLKALEELSRDHSAELGEIPAVAILGLPALAGHVPQLDIPAGRLRLLEAMPGSESEGSPSPGAATATAPSADAYWTTTYTEEGHGYWLTAVGPDEFRLRARFSTAQYDTVIDATAADLAGAPAGDLAQLLIGPLDVTRYVALRPEDLAHITDPRPDVLIGTNLLSHFRVTIDMANRRMQFERLREPAFPVAEQAYYRARAAGAADDIERFLRDHGSSRLAGEAAVLLLQARLEADPPDRAALRRALEARIAAERPERRAAQMVLLADSLLQGPRGDRYALAEEALTLGREHAGADLNARAVHDIQARLGLIALRRDDLDTARRALLSAAFGLPRDPLVNLWLGDYYERAGRLSRAWSRYVQATLVDDPPREAFVGLDRLNRNAEFRAGFTMTDAEQLLEGRVVEFHAAERYAPSDAEQVPPVRLVELFTNLDNPRTTAAELAFSALGEYFADSGVVLVQYHVPWPEADPLVSPASLVRGVFYGVKATPATFCDGQPVETEEGNESKAADVFATYRAAGEKSSRPAAEWRLDGALAAEADVVRGEIRLDGPVATGDLFLTVLWCERVVMAPGANKLVLHRQVVRGLLSPDDGFAIPESAGRRTFAVRVAPAELTATLERTIAAMEVEQNIRFTMRPTYTDPRLSRVVAVLQDRATRRVLAARALDIAAHPDAAP